MLQVKALGCERDRRQLFSALAFSLAPGEALQITGSNGSGKSTLLKILVGLYTSFEGDVVWNVASPPLYLAHSPGVNQRLTVAENIVWLCGLHEQRPADAEIDAVLAALGMAGYQDTPCRNLSEGQRKRVNLARFLLLQNACWVMDEPFSSIDANGLDYLQHRMQSHLDAGGALIVTSHQALALSSDINTVALS